ncbi:MAG: BatD family protein, partial [Bacteroidota bacterium]
MPVRDLARSRLPKPKPKQLLRAAFRLGALAALAVALAGPASGQTADASVSSRGLAVGEELTYSLTLRGGRSGPVDPPAGSGALRLSSPIPTLDITTTFNGETERRVAWAYEATRTGVGRIDGLRVTVGGRSLRVDPVQVRVSPAPAASAPTVSSDEIFARAEVSRETAFIGQQVIVEYVLYFQPQIQPRQTAPIGTWDAAGFWREEMEVPSAYPRSVTLGGEPYEAVTIRRIALFPTRAGELELAEMRFDVDLLRTTTRGFGADPFAPFFSPFSSRYDEEEVTAPAATITVRPLPDGAPPGFGGAVGQFELETVVDERQVEAGEAVEVRATISGTGNTATLRAPQIEPPRGVDAYAPRADREVFRTAEPLRGVAVFAYTLVPQGGGVFEVPAAPWSYFDPADGQYKTLRTEAVEITALGPSLAEAAAADPDGPAALILSAPVWERARPSVTWLWVALAGGLSLPLLAGLGLLAVRMGRRRLGAASPRGRRKRLASAIRTRLDAARALDGPAAAAEVERAVHAALDRLGVPAATLPAHVLPSRLDAAGLTPD